MLFCGQLVALALGASTWVLAAASFFAGAAIAIHVALWFTIFQREVSEHAQSRVSSYDTLGSFVLTPLGFVAAGFVGGAIGLSSAAWLAVGAILVLSSIMLLIPSVWRVGRTPEATTLPA
jgi:predicted membrane-bound spermidine synthase